MRMMVVFEKGETLRYIGHLDLMRAMQRALRRSGLPIRYSNGFNPHIRLSFAAPEYMEKFLDITPGSVSVLGLMNDGENHVQLLMDEDVLKGEYIGCHPCINTSSLRLRTADLMEKILPAVHHEPRIVTLPQE